MPSHQLEYQMREAPICAVYLHGAWALHSPQIAGPSVSGAPGGHEITLGCSLNVLCLYHQTASSQGDACKSPCP